MTNQPTKTPEAHSANISMVKQALSANPEAATAYRNLRSRFVTEVIASAAANLSADNQEREDAARASLKAEDAAHALLTGLMLAYMPDWDKYEASAAATDYSRPDFDRKAMFDGKSGEAKRIYLSLEAVDDYTARIAPHRVIRTHADTTLYLFSEADARIFTERTGMNLKPYHTL